MLAGMHFSIHQDTPQHSLGKRNGAASGYDTAMEDGGLEHHSRPYGVYGLDWNLAIAVH
jgi:hypothetical protein